MTAMTRRDALRAIALGLAAPAVLRGRYRIHAQSDASYSARAIDLVRSSVVVDLLNQFQFPDYAVQPPNIEQWLSRPGTFTPADFARYRDSGITVFSLGSGPGDYDGAIAFFGRWNGFLAGYSDWFRRIDDASDFGRAKAQRAVPHEGIHVTFDELSGTMDETAPTSKEEP